MIQLVIDCGFITSLMLLGAWLETVGGINDAIDRFLTPLPLGGTGLFISLLEWNVS